jgi:hypothetical protein
MPPLQGHFQCYVWVVENAPYRGIFMCDLCHYQCPLREYFQCLLCITLNALYRGIFNALYLLLIMLPTGAILVFYMYCCNCYFQCQFKYYFHLTINAPYSSITHSIALSVDICFFIALVASPTTKHLSYTLVKLIFYFIPWNTSFLILTCNVSYLFKKIDKYQVKTKSEACLRATGCMFS